MFFFGPPRAYVGEEGVRFSLELTSSMRILLSSLPVSPPDSTVTTVSSPV